MGILKKKRKKRGREWTYTGCLLSTKYFTYYSFQLHSSSIRWAVVFLMDRVGLRQIECFVQGSSKAERAFRPWTG